MPDWKKLLEQFKTLLAKLDMTQKIVIGVVIAVIAGSLVAVGGFSSEKNQVVLFPRLDAKQFATTASKLDDLGFHYTTSGTEAIFVSPEKKQEIILALAKENAIPTGVNGWELFDQNEWTETQFDKEMKVRRAVAGHLQKTINLIRDVKSSSVTISWPEKNEYFQDSIKPVKASVLLQFVAGVTELDKKTIQGIQTLVYRAIPGVDTKNISIADPMGKIINDFDNVQDRKDHELDLVERKFRIKERERMERLASIRKALGNFYGEDRYDVLRYDIDMRWDEQTTSKQEIYPVVMREDNPNTPYSELETKDSLTVSRKRTREKFRGHGFTPEGPAGTEPNIPPGYKDKDYQKAEYNKDEDIENEEINRRQIEIVKQPWEFKCQSLALVLDGRWERLGEFEHPQKGWVYKRKYYPITKSEIDPVKKSLKAAIRYGSCDQIEVQHLQKDRSKEHAAEDAKLASAKRTKKILIISLVALLVIAVFFFVYHAIKREIERRRRLREEELAAQQQMMREAALRAMDEQGVVEEESLEYRARREMLENVINLAKERPEDVAHLIRTWLADE